MTQALNKFSKQIQKEFEKTSPLYEYASLTPEAQVAYRALQLVNRLVPDKRRLKKYDRETVNWLKQKSKEKREAKPTVVEGKGWRIPSYTK
jgi:hypothetical protein